MDPNQYPMMYEIFAVAISNIKYDPTPEQRLLDMEFAAKTLEQQTEGVDNQMKEARATVKTETQRWLFKITEMLAKINGTFRAGDRDDFPEGIRFHHPPTKYQIHLDWAISALEFATNFKNAMKKNLPDIPLEFLVYTLGPKPFTGNKRGFVPAVKAAKTILSIPDPEKRRETVQAAIDNAIAHKKIKEVMPHLDTSRFQVTCTDTRTTIKGYTPNKHIGRELELEPSSNEQLPHHAGEMMPHSADILAVVCVMAYGYRAQQWNKSANDTFPLVETKDVVQVQNYLNHQARGLHSQHGRSDATHTKTRSSKRPDHPDDSYTPGNAKRPRHQEIPQVDVPRPLPTDPHGLDGRQNRAEPGEAEHNTTDDGANISENSAATRPNIIDTSEQSRPPYEDPVNQENSILDTTNCRPTPLTTPPATPPTPQRVTGGAQSTSIPMDVLPAHPEALQEPGIDPETTEFLGKYLPTAIAEEIKKCTMVSKPATGSTTVNPGSIKQTKDRLKQESYYSFPPLYQAGKNRLGQTQTNKITPSEFLSYLQGGKLIDVAIDATATPQPPNEHNPPSNISYTSFARHVEATRLETQLPPANALFLSTKGSASEWLPLPTPFNMTISVPPDSTESTEEVSTALILTKQWHSSIPTTDGKNTITVTKLNPGQSLRLDGGLDYLHVTQNSSFRQVSVDWAGEQQVTEKIKQWAATRPHSAAAKHSDIGITSDWLVNQIYLQADQKQIIRQVANLPQI